MLMEIKPANSVVERLKKYIEKHTIHIAMLPLQGATATLLFAQGVALGDDIKGLQPFYVKQFRVSLQGKYILSLM